MSYYITQVIIRIIQLNATTILLLHLLERLAKN